MKCFGLIFAVFLGFSPLVFADSVDYQGAGALSNHTAFTNGMSAAGYVWEIGDRLLEIDDLTIGQVTTGNLGVIDVTSGVLTKCAAGLCFSGGNLDIDSLSNVSIFDGSLIKGSISNRNGILVLSAFLSNGAVAVIRDNKNTFSSQAIIHSPSSVPEPSMMSLMGTGFFATAFALLRRRRKEI